MPIRRHSLLLLLASSIMATPGLVHSQVGFPGGIRESGGQVVDAGLLPQAGAAFTTAAPALTWFFGSGGRASENARGFSALIGFSLEAAVPVEAALGYARTEPDGADGSNAFSATVEVAIPSTALRALGTKLAVSGDGVWVPDVAQSYSAAASVTQAFGKRVEVVGSAAYAATNPEVGATTTGFRPSASIGVVPVTGTGVRLEYTFDNDVDGEDSVELRATQRVTPRGFPALQLRAGIAKHGVVSLGVLFFP